MCWKYILRKKTLSAKIFSMDIIQPFATFDRLNMLREKGYQQYDILEFARKMNHLMREDSDANGPQLAGLVYAIIYHYQLTKGKYSFGSIPFKGKLISSYGGVTFDFRTLPPPLQQMLIILMKEICSGECHEISY